MRLESSFAGLTRFLASGALAVGLLSSPAQGQTQPPPIPPEALAEACVQMQMDIKAEVISTIEAACARAVEILELLAELGFSASDIANAGEEGMGKLGGYGESGLGFLINCDRDCQVLFDSYEESPDRIEPLRAAVTAARQDAVAMVAEAMQAALKKIAEAIARLTTPTTS